MIQLLNNKILINNYQSDILTKETVIREISVNPFANYLLYIENNKIIGYIYYSDIYERAEINMFEVDTKYRNDKIGNKLLQYFINKVKKNITLEVKEDNYIAIHLYKKYGFKEITKRKGYYNGKDGILMQRQYQ